MSDDTTKPIEQVKIGDTVLSKNEQTGAVAAKRVTNVSVRADIWTRKLSFDNGAVLETTDEHPLYADGRGFVKAKEVGIGNSIVTRAGPSAKVVVVEADVKQATVYNFTVDDFHTYFVGDSALWVHNVDCKTYPESGVTRYDETLQASGTPQKQIFEAGDNTQPITDIDKVIEGADGNIWIVERKGTVNMYNPRNTKSTEQQIADYLDKQVTAKLDKLKRAILEGDSGNLASIGITDRTKVQIAYEFHGTPRPDGTIAPIDPKDLLLSGFNAPPLAARKAP